MGGKGVDLAFWQNSLGRAVTLPEENQWDETTCRAVVCQHPQCWASIRRVENGHPRILSPSGKTEDVEDKLPLLTIINISNKCLQAKTVAHWKSSKITFPKDRCSSKPVSKRRGRPHKGLRGKDVTSLTSKLPKISVLNLNEAKLPFSENVRNLVVTWIPDGTEKNVSFAGKTSAFPDHYEKKRKELVASSKSFLFFSERQGLHSRSPEVIVPPPSPVHLFEQVSSESTPVWTQIDMLSKDLLKECFLTQTGRVMPYPEMKIELAKKKKNLSLEKDQPDSAILSKMYLTVHRLTLQTPTSRYPELLRKQQYNLQRQERFPGVGFSGYRKQRQQRKGKGKGKTHTKKQETLKKIKNESESLSLRYRSLSLQEQQKQQDQEQEQEQEEKIERRATIRHGSIKEPEIQDIKDYDYEYISSPESSSGYDTDDLLSKISALDETMQDTLVARQKKKDPSNLLENVVKTSWKPELKLLRILQATADENETNQLSRTHSEESLDA